MKKTNMVLGLAITSIVAGSLMTSVMAAEEIYDIHGNVVSQEQANEMIDLGHGYNVSLTEGGLDVILKNIPVGGEFGRYGIGGQSVSTAFQVMGKINGGDFSNISKDHLSRFLITIAAVLRLDEPGALTDPYKGFPRFAENHNVKFDLDGYKIIGYLTGAAAGMPVSLEISKLMDAYDTLKANASAIFQTDAFAADDGAVPPAGDHAAHEAQARASFNAMVLENYRINAIKNIYAAYAKNITDKNEVVPNPKRPGADFTDAESGIAASMMQQVPNDRDSFLTGLTLVFSAARAVAILDDMIGN